MFKINQWVEHIFMLNGQVIYQWLNNLPIELVYTFSCSYVTNGKKPSDLPTETAFLMHVSFKGPVSI